MKTLRWLLTIPLWMTGILLWVLVTTALQGIALRFCPPELVLSDTCATDWYAVLDQIGLSVGAAAGALAMVALPTCIAPSDRYRVAVVFFSLGSLLALLVLFAFGTMAVAPFLAALTMGLLAVAFFGRGRNAV